MCMGCEQRVVKLGELIITIPEKEPFLQDCARLSNVQIEIHNENASGRHAEDRTK